MKVCQLKLGPMDNFSYLVWDEAAKDAALIDPAWQPEKLADVVKREGVKPACVLLTHGHPDHVNAVRYFTAGAALPVYLHEADHCMLEEAPTGLRSMADGDVLKAGPLEFKVMHTPGHTPGSVCYAIGDALFTGDTLFIGGCGRVDLPGSSAEDLYDSFVKLAALPDAAAVYPGHSYNGDTSTIGVQKEYNFYLKLARQGRREDFLRSIS